MNKNPGRGGREKRFPLSLDTYNAEELAPFLLRCGYKTDAVVNTLVSRCSLDPTTARSTVNAAILAQEKEG